MVATLDCVICAVVTITKMISRYALRKRNAKGRRIRHERLVCWPYHFAAWWRDDRIIGIVGTTPAMCSCRMCGNPRRKWGNAGMALTMQERRAPTINEWGDYDE